ncbi:MAG: methionine--tRNA ligase [Lachnospiraceae bacterium]|nr:methionine--tRNA ligase [Lachnospiraceae bacterium]
MQSKGKYYLTTAIAYTSGKPHIGNCYEIVLADAIARYKRADGYDVHFLTGSDEHGQKVETRAVEAGMSPKEFVDEVADIIRGQWDLMGATYDRFIRTTDEDHEKQIQKIFKKFYEQGDIYKDAYEGMYCGECEAFYTETQLNEGKCPVCGGAVHQAREEAYFFKMKKYAPRLIEYINEHPEFIQPVSRKNEMMNNFLLPGLQDLCVSRTSFKWGIPVDFDPGHVVYVWVDALSNYITGIGYDTDTGGSELFRKNWPADLHLIGKDIIRFHTIYWPIFLMALGLPLPKQIFGHPWLLQSGEKMSKSKGNVIYFDDMAKLFGVDAVRYFVLHEMPYENDGVISWELMVERFNSDLANTLGNLVNRTIAMSVKYFEGVIEDKGVDGAPDKDFISVITGCYEKVEDKMQELRVADALTEIFNLFKRCNKYIDETEPWVLAKDAAEQDRLATVLYNLAEGITAGASLLAPFMPETAEKIFTMMKTKARDFDTLGTFGAYPSGTIVSGDAQILFARKELDEVLHDASKIAEKQREEYMKSQQTAAKNLRAAGMTGEAERIEAALKAAGQEEADGEAGPKGAADVHLEAKPEITYDQFDQCQFAVGEVIACEAVPKSKKLLCMQVQIGDKVRQILSGIQKYYTPQEMVGKKVCVLVNLKPATLAGLQSEGMILSAEAPDGTLVLLSPEKDVPAGSGIA